MIKSPQAGGDGKSTKVVATPTSTRRVSNNTNSSNIARDIPKQRDDDSDRDFTPDLDAVPGLPVKPKKFMAPPLSSSNLSVAAFVPQSKQQLPAAVTTIAISVEGGEASRLEASQLPTPSGRTLLDNSTRVTPTHSYAYQSPHAHLAVRFLMLTIVRESVHFMIPVNFITLTTRRKSSVGRRRSSIANANVLGGGIASRVVTPSTSIRNSVAQPLDDDMDEEDDERGPRKSIIEQDGATPQPNSSPSYTNFFEPSQSEDPFETDAYSPETRKKYLEEVQRDQQLVLLLNPLRQTVHNRMMELPFISDRKNFGAAIRNFVASKLWQSVFAVIRFAQVAHAEWHEEAMAQNLIKKMAPLCAIRLRQRLKKARVRHMLPTVSKPSLEIFKADRTLSLFPEDQLEKLRDTMDLVFFFKNETMLYRGVQDDECFMIEKGVVEMKDGQTVMSTYRKNHTIGALGMIVSEPRLYSIVAKTDVFAWIIKKTSFDMSLNAADVRTKNALAVVNELRQKNIREVFCGMLHPQHLRQFLIFAGIRDQILETAVNDAAPKVFKKGDVLLRGGDTATTAVYVIRGRVRLSVVPQMPLSLEKTIQQHVAEAVCLVQPKKKPPVASPPPEAAPADKRRKKKTQGASKSIIAASSQTFIMRGDDGAMEVMLGTPARAASRSAAAVTAETPAAVETSDFEHHSNGMACDIACPVVISVPAMYSADNRHRFQVTALSDSVDTVMFHCDKLKPLLASDFDTEHTVEYNLTCLALPFIRTLPRNQLLSTLFPRCFAFDFLHALKVEQLEQIPVVFAPGDEIMLEAGMEACALIILKGRLKNAQAPVVTSGESNPSDAGRGQPVPFLWPDISYVATCGAWAQDVAVTSIEGLLIRRKQLLDVIQGLKPRPAEVLRDALKAHYASRTGRTTAPQASTAVAANKKSSGMERIKLALSGDIASGRNEGLTSTTISSGATLPRSDNNQGTNPRYPDTSVPMATLVEQRLAQQQRRDAQKCESPVLSKTSARRQRINSDGEVAWDAYKEDTTVVRCKQKCFTISTDVLAEVGIGDGSTGCLVTQVPEVTRQTPLFQNDSQQVAEKRSMLSGAVSPVSDDGSLPVCVEQVSLVSPRSVGAPTTVLKDQIRHQFLIVTDTPVRSPLPPALASPNSTPRATRMHAMSLNVVPRVNPISVVPTAALPPGNQSVIRRRQLELMKNCSELREIGLKDGTSPRRTLNDTLSSYNNNTQLHDGTFVPTASSTRLLMEDFRKMSAALPQSPRRF